MAIEFDTLQFAAMELRDEIIPFDEAGLEALSTAQLREQSDAREALHDYVTALWNRAQAKEPDAAPNDEFAALRGLRDITEALRDYANVILLEREG
ncbi:hypothetical protein ACFC5T_16895 [Streptomyces sp. NPDC055961]|uniref:hypothetical protein n=1 Tax=Streptomyces sp. NPDC055961 TaxID=3345666 RepID=UPI0035DFDCEF